MSPNPIIEASDGNFYGSAHGVAVPGASAPSLRSPPPAPSPSSSPSPRKYDSRRLRRLNPPYGADPGPLVEGNDGYLYGTTQFGGPSGSAPTGTIFKISKTGAMTVLHEFVGYQGGRLARLPRRPVFPSRLIQGADGNFYGTTPAIADRHRRDHGQKFLGQGTFFSISPGGSFSLSLHSLAADGSEGVQPFGPLTQGPDGNFYSANKAYGYPGTVNASAVHHKSSQHLPDQRQLLQDLQHRQLPDPL